MISRRKFFGMLAAVGAAELLIPKRTIFLPPRGGWPRQALAQMVIPRSDLDLYAEGIASGRFSYDINTEMMTLYELDPGHVNGKWHTQHGRDGPRTYEWDDVQVSSFGHSRRALADDYGDPDNENAMAAALKKQREQEETELIRSRWPQNEAEWCAVNVLIDEEEAGGAKLRYPDGTVDMGALIHGGGYDRMLWPFRFG